MHSYPAERSKFPLPEMTYTATGFSNPVRVIFQAIFRPTIRENTRQTVAEHFRTAIHREREEVHIVERFVLKPVRELAFRFARLVARMHQGRINAYTGYVLLALLAFLYGNGVYRLRRRAVGTAQ